MANAETADVSASSQPHHRLSVHGRAGSLPLAFEAAFSAPWTVLFGPSGCGKSTLLRAICGLTDDLSVQLSRHQGPGDTWITLQDDRLAVPPEARGQSYVPQQAGLFPHLSVRDNIAFAQTIRHRSSPAASPVDEVIALLQLETLTGRRPQQLSGGEQQRVSLARALAVPDARLVLLDEPFAGVDRALRDHLLPRVQAYLAQRSVPVISVTHDVDEAFLLGAEVIRLHDGQNSAQGPASVVLATEAARIVQLLTGA